MKKKLGLILLAIIILSWVSISQARKYEWYDKPTGESLKSVKYLLLYEMKSSHPLIIGTDIWGGQVVEWYSGLWKPLFFIDTDEYLEWALEDNRYERVDLIEIYTPVTKRKLRRK